MKRSIIFDLDQTLIDSSIAEQSRKTRNWQLVYSQIPEFNLYAGLDTVFEFIKNHQIRVVIVSTSPASYVRKVCDHFNIPYNCIIGYHDAKPIKPHPAPMLKAMELLNERPENIISYGDRAIDIIASKSANIKAVGCFWGTQEEENLIHSKPDINIYSPLEIIETLL